MSANAQIATVTGASGFIAGVLIEQLLKKGYTVHGTVRSLKDTSKLQPFLDAFAPSLASKQLQLFEADLAVTGSFANAIKGSHFVFHTASPFFLAKTTDPQRDLVDPAVNGTANVLNTAFAESSVKKIIVTSSVAAVRSFIPEGQTKVFSEKDWNTTSTLETNPYPLSKTLAEKKAWQLFEEHKKAGGSKVLLVVNPAWVLGPPVHVRSANDSESLKNVATLFGGAWKDKGAPAMRFNIVDVRDVAAVHIAVAEKDGSEGRYITCHAESYDPLDWSRILTAAFPENKDNFPTKIAEGGLKQGHFEIDNSKLLKELGIKLIPVEKTFKDSVDGLKKFGLIKA